MEEVVGSIPTSSTIFRCPASPSSRGLGHYPFKVATRVRIPLGTPIARGARGSRRARRWPGDGCASNSEVRIRNGDAPGTANRRSRRAISPVVALPLTTRPALLVASALTYGLEKPVLHSLLRRYRDSRQSRSAADIPTAEVAHARRASSLPESTPAASAGRGDSRPAAAQPAPAVRPGSWLRRVAGALHWLAPGAVSAKLAHCSWIRYIVSRVSSMNRASREFRRTSEVGGKSNRLFAKCWSSTVRVM